MVWLGEQNAENPSNGSTAFLLDDDALFTPIECDDKEANKG